VLPAGAVRLKDIKRHERKARVHRLVAHC
jgi:hypothetical protein